MKDTKTFAYTSYASNNQGGKGRRGQHMRKYRKTTARIAKGVIHFPVSVKEDLALTNKDEFEVRLTEDTRKREDVYVTFTLVPRNTEGSLLFHEYKSGGGWVFISGFLREFGYNPDMVCEVPFVTSNTEGFFSVMVKMPDEWRYDYGEDM